METSPYSPMDVNRDGAVTPLDVLLIINYLNKARGDENEYALDVSQDGYISPLDALMVINYLNQLNGANGEGEYGDSRWSREALPSFLQMDGWLTVLPRAADEPPWSLSSLLDSSSHLGHIISKTFRQHRSRVDSNNIFSASAAEPVVLWKRTSSWIDEQEIERAGHVYSYTLRARVVLEA